MYVMFICKVIISEKASDDDDDDIDRDVVAKRLKKDVVCTLILSNFKNFIFIKII